MREPSRGEALQGLGLGLDRSPRATPPTRILNITWEELGARCFKVCRDMKGTVLLCSYQVLSLRAESSRQL